MNPLFPDEPDNPHKHTPQHGDSYLLHKQHGHHLKPSGQGHDAPTASAIELIKRKVDALYAYEPNAAQELSETKNTVPPRSRHQQFMYNLSTSGKSLAAIQTAWHAYYASLTDDEKREVWQEFYTANGQQPSMYTKYMQKQSAAKHTIKHGIPKQEQTFEPPSPHGIIVVSDHMPAPEPPPERRSMATIKKQVSRKVHLQNQKQTKARQHLQSLAFGLGMGVIVLVVVLFGLFNEMVIAPFIRPGSQNKDTPIILSTDGIAPTNKNEVIIPKINVELPAVYGNSVTESDIQKTLEGGVAHYASTAIPGQQGNAAFFGHSSNNIFNKGQYKFAFVLLHDLEPGDIFYLTYNGKVYTYKVYDKKIVQPSDTWVLNPVQSKMATAVLITCDPPGTSLRRLVVWGEQINPDPTGNNTAPAAVPAAQEVKQLPSNSPSLWSRFWNWVKS